MTAMLGRLRVAVAVGVPVGLVAVSAVLVLARWPAYWQWVAPEQTPMTFVQALLLWSVGLAAALLGLLAAVGRQHRRVIVTWCALAVGFVAVMLDERFALHERVRDGFVGGLGYALPWGAPGDYLLVIYAAVGILLVPRVIRLLSDDRLALRLFVAGVALAAVAVAADTFDITRLELAAQRAAQSAEEVGEGFADALLAAALWTHVIYRIERHHGDTSHTPFAADTAETGPSASDLANHQHPIEPMTMKLLAAAGGALLLAVLVVLAHTPPSQASPRVLDGYVLLEGTKDTALSTTVSLLDDIDDRVSENTWDVAEIMWEGVDGAWHYNWNLEPPHCLIPTRPVRAQLAVVDVTATNESEGYSRAVWLRCLDDQPAMR